MLPLKENSSFTWSTHEAGAHLHRGLRLTELFTMCEWRTEETDLLSASKYLDDENKGSLGCVEVITQRSVCHCRHSINPIHTHRQTHTYTVCSGKYMENTWKLEAKLADCLLHDSGCLYSPSHLFSSHRQHAAALLHSDWLVLGPRAERSGTQAAEQVESQDRRGQRSLQGQTGVRPGHNRPPSELTQPANRLAPALSTPQCSGDGNWASNLPSNAKGAFMWPSEAPGSVAGG